MNHVLLVDDEPRTLLSFSTLLKSSGLRHVTTIEDSRNVMPFLEKQPVALVVLDLSMPFVPGQDLLAEIRQRFPGIPVIVMTATNEIHTAVECMKNGAMDYLVKPVESNRFLSSVNRALEIHRLEQEVSHLKKYVLSDKLENPSAFAHIITTSKKMLAIFKYIEAISQSPQPVLITGETGVGKELVARALYLSGKSREEFVAVNVAGLDDTMFSDTLFGHKKGAFTGADARRDGLIARAARGTIFLDEIGDLNPQSQVKLLRLIQEHEYYPLGSDIPQKTDAHIIVATNRDPGQLMEAGKFRNDLYFRLSAHHIHVPPLRERREDIPLLLDYFLHKAAQSLKKKKPVPPPQLTVLLAHYDFPGNVRELESMVFDAVSRHTSGVLSMESFKRVIKAEIPTPGGEPAVPLEEVQPLEKIFGKFPTLKQVEDYMLDEALRRAEGNQGIAASFLGITRQALNKRLTRRKK
ncbi:MAG: sigma-54-dependent Fis family transcriptional regulator [Candidatus Aminicenantes bacterium]|nr:MAG: sigma-54-dependent Fis family transcriptional regulator [Candidatus Aminicenantes bacterium]